MTSPAPRGGGRRLDGDAVERLHAEFVIELSSFVGQNSLVDFVRQLDELIAAARVDGGATQLREAADEVEKWPTQNHVSLLRNKADMLDGTI